MVLIWNGSRVDLPTITQFQSQQVTTALKSTLLDDKPKIYDVPNGWSGAWLSYASIVCTVRDVDGVPVPWPTKKSEVKALANKIGNEGIVAVQKAMSDQENDEQTEAEVAKN